MFCLRRIVVAHPVDLDRQFGGDAVEIENVGTDGVLSTKLQASEPSSAQA